MTLALLIVAGMAGATTAAAATTAELSIPYAGCEDGQGNRYDYVMRVHGEMDWWEPRLVAVQLFGDDPTYDDRLTGYMRFEHVGGLGYYTVDFCVNSSTLDEDWGRDEIFARVGISGGGSATSNVITGNF
jgi:hypothetical protein